MSQAPPKPSAPKSSNATWLIVGIVLLGCCGVGGIGTLVGTALLLPAVQAGREAARRTQCANNLKQVGLALHNYHDTYKTFPASAVLDENDQPLHSWRVAILPFIGRKDLYDRYNFNEPWDSPNNMLLADQMPAEFKCPSEVLPPNQTRYQAVVSSNSVMRPNKWTRIAEITDGTANTIVIVEGNTPVIWTQPDDLELDLGETGGSRHPGIFQAVIADGSIKPVTTTMSPQEFSNAVGINDGMAPGF